jgi:hypothetical protein
MVIYIKEFNFSENLQLIYICVLNIRRMQFKKIKCSKFIAAENG